MINCPIPMFQVPTFAIFSKNTLMTSNDTLKFRNKRTARDNLRPNRVL